MNRTNRINNILMIAVYTLAASVASGERRPIDAKNSQVRVKVYKAGLFSVLAHDHDISAPLIGGQVDESEPASVAIRIDASKMLVLDPKESEKNRADIQERMSGPDVLDTARFPEIAFQSTSAEKRGPDAWLVRGNLALHGQTKAVFLTVAKGNGRYQGSTTLKQSDFGIKPVSIAGGAVRVKDEVRIEFEIVPVE